LNTTTPALTVPTNLTNNFTIVVELYLPLEPGMTSPAKRRPANAYFISTSYYPHVKPDFSKQRSQVALGTVFGMLALLILLAFVVYYRVKHREDDREERFLLLPGTPRRAISRTVEPTVVKMEMVSSRDDIIGGD
jgi:hypothetical protein